MAIARRGSQRAIAATGSAVASLSVSFPAATTQGDMVAVAVAQQTDAIPVGGVTDNQGNVYERDKTGPMLITAQSAIFSALNIADGTSEVTYTPTSAQVCTVAISEYSGVATSSALDATAQGGSASAPGGDWTSGLTAETVQDDELAVAAVTIMGNPATIPTLSPFLEAATSTDALSMTMSDRITTVTAEQQCSWTSVAEGWDACIATYRGVPADVAASAGFILGEDVARPAERYG